MTNQQTAKLAEPGIGALDLPSSSVASQFPSIVVASLFVVFSIGHDQIDASLFPSPPQGIGIETPIGDHPLRLLPWPAFAARDADLFERGVRKCNFCRRGTLQPNSQRNTFTVSQYHPLCAFATPGFAHCGAPFLAGAKLPSRKDSSQFSSPCSSSAPSNVRHAVSHMPSSCHCFRRRQQVDGEGYSSGRNRHAAPVCRIHSIPSRQLRLGAGGRPRPSLRLADSGNSGPINSHCSSVNSLCRFFMTEAQQPVRLMHKYLL